MSSTTVYKGSFGDKPSSRVLRPPGGGSSNIFGGADENQVKPKPAECQPKVTTPEVSPQTNEDRSESKCDKAADVAPDANSAASVESANPSVSSTATAKPEPMTAAQPTVTKGRNSGFNPITGEPYGTTVVKPADDKKQAASVTVKQPPGGASSGLW